MKVKTWRDVSFGSYKTGEIQDLEGPRLEGGLVLIEREAEHFELSQAGRLICGDQIESITNEGC